jgi:multiple sugar transport system permease protein
MLLVAPAVILMGVFFVAPLIQVVIMSFFDWPLLGQPSWTGVDNYVEMFSDPQFTHALGFSALYTVILVPALLAIGLALALLLHRKRRGVGLFRTIYFAPVVIGFASAAYLWIYLVDPRIGLLDAILQNLHLTSTPISWLARPELVSLTVLSMVIWKSAGFGMLLLLTGLQAIPQDLFDAAKIDRASRWQVLGNLTLPLLRRPIALTAVLSAVGALLSFEQFYLLTGGAGDTTPVVMAIFNVSFTRFQLGMGASMSIFLLAIVVIVSAVQLFILRDKASDR